jgi:acetyl esterase/lipase
MPGEDILSKKPPDADYRLSYGQDANQFIDVHAPAARGSGPLPAFFFIHGGYWRAKYGLAYAGHLCHALKQKGVCCWNVEYRRVGNPGGGWPGTFEDIRSAFRFLLAHAETSREHLDRKRICVAGHSAGGQLALSLAAHEPGIKHALSLAGVLDLHRAWELHLSNDAVVEFLGGTPLQVPEHYREASPAERPIPQTVQKLVHGTADTDVPYEISKGYADRKKKSGEDVELITLPETGHFEIVDPGSSVWPKIEQLVLTMTSL